MTITHDGRPVDVAVATNKKSYIYVFDIETGEPIFPIEETPVPPSNVPGEVASKTQPIPILPAPLARTSITADDLTQASPEANAEARAMLAQMYGNGGNFVPLGLDQFTIVAPGFSGGNSWGGMAADRKGVIYANVANAASMSKTEDNSAVMNGQAEGRAAGGAQNGTPSLAYAFSGYGRFSLQNGEPAVGEPAGTLNAVDLNTGQYRWTIPNVRGFSGSGPVVTESGVLFVASGNQFQAYQSSDGQLLWQQQLPAMTGNTPSVYMVGGKQYVVLASGGRGEPAYVAYALPN